MMSAVDKLHKLYASTAGPVVWARSTWVEALNEPDGLKAGIMGAAAGDSESSARGGGASFLWGAVAGGVEVLVGGTRMAGAVGSSLRSIAGGSAAAGYEGSVSAWQRMDINACCGVVIRPIRA